MFVTTRRNLLITLFLSIIICVSSVSISNDGQEENHSVRERRQTLPVLVATLIPVVVSLLATVSALLLSLAAALPIILGALGLGGLGVALGIIVAQLSVVVLSLAGRKRRDVVTLLTFPAATNTNVIPTVNQAVSAVANIQGLRSIVTGQLDITAGLTKSKSDLTKLQLALNSATSTVQEIQVDLKSVVTGLNNTLSQADSAMKTIVNTVQSNIPAIDAGCGTTLNYIATLVPSLGKNPLKKQLSAVQLILRNVANAQNATLINTANVYATLSSVSSTTNALLRSIATQFGDVIGGALVSCPATG